MVILVTGCAGFIGWKVTEHLLDESHTILGVDNLSDTYDPSLKKWRLEQLKKYPNFRFLFLDILDVLGLERLVFSSQPIDAVINLAACAGVRKSIEDPKAYFETNVIGTLNLLEQGRKFGVKKFIQASTSAVYGVHNSLPFREDADTDRPLSPYAASKKASEVLCYTYHHLYGLDITVLRYFSVYGPAGRPDMSLFRFVHWVSEGNPVPVFGDGSQSRDFTFIDDIAQGTLAALRPMEEYQIINLGSDQPVVLLDAIRLIEQFVGKRAQIVYQPAHPADVPITWADISKAKEMLGWQPGTPFQEGIARLVEWYYENQEWVRCLNFY